MKSVSVIQHTSADYLGLMEDHLEGRHIGFRYFRPFTEGGRLPSLESPTDGLILLGGGPWGSAGQRNLPGLVEEVELTYAGLQRGLPIIGIGLGAQILALAAGGRSLVAPLSFTVASATRTDDTVLHGYLPPDFPIAEYMRDRPEPPRDARVLATDEHGQACVFQIGDKAFGFTGHPGAKLAMMEDLIMEFDESPIDPSAPLAALKMQRERIEDALVPIMTGLVHASGWMAHDTLE